MHGENITIPVEVTANMESLSTCVLEKITKYLSFEDLLALSTTCRAMLKICPEFRSHSWSEEGRGNYCSRILMDSKPVEIRIQLPGSLLVWGKEKVEELWGQPGLSYGRGVEALGRGPWLAYPGAWVAYLRCLNTLDVEGHQDLELSVHHKCWGLCPTIHIFPKTRFPDGFLERRVREGAVTIVYSRLKTARDF